MTEAPEVRWARDVYQGAAPQLTLRAALTGLVLGATLCLSNLYVVLKTGWSLGITITATVLAFAAFRLLGALGLVRRPFSALENNAVASVASAAAWMTGGGNMAALPALLLLTGLRPGGLAMFAWFAVIAALGVFAAIPIKRQLINREQLAFPQSVATAQTIRSMHEGQGSATGRWLLGAGLVAAAFAALRDVRVSWLTLRLPARLSLPFTLSGKSLAAWSLGFDVSLVLVGGGALMGPRTAWSLLVGAVLTYGVLAPHLLAVGAIGAADFKSIVEFTLWPGAALLASSGLMSFALQWRRASRALGDLLAALKRRGPARAPDDPLDAIEAPTWWFVAGFAVLSPIIVAMMRWWFGIPWWAGAMSIPLSLAVGVIAARVTGETDVTPTKAMGPLTQLAFGVALPADLTANVMGANVTTGVGLHAADLLGDLKTGYLLGANPRLQVLAQLLGILAGAAVVVPAFELLVPTADLLGSEQFPAPAVMVWASVSRALTQGLSGLGPGVRLALLLASLLGAALALAEALGPEGWRRWVPSPAGLGIAMVTPGSFSLSMFAGAMLAASVRRAWPRFGQTGLVPVASGLVAGESLMGIGIALSRALGASL